MTPKLTKELYDALQKNAGKPLDVQAEGDPTHQVYVVMTRQEFKRLIYGDSDLTADEMMAATAHLFNDPDGWGDPAMDVYDEQDDSSSAGT